MEQRKEKNLSIEILRIIAMLWIVAFHYVEYGEINMFTEPFSLNWAVLAFAKIGGGVGNCIFVLITGYLLGDKKFKLSRIVVLWAEIWFYSVIFGITALYLGVWEISFVSIVSVFCPIITRRYWWMTTYFVLYLFTPFINKMINVLNRKQLKTFIVVCVLFFSVMPTFFRWNWLVEPDNLLLFLTLYVLGAYVKKHEKQFFVKKSSNLIVFIISTLVIWGSAIVGKVIGREELFYFMWPMYKTPIVALAILLFEFVLRFRSVSIIPIGNKIVTWFGSSAFGVYLIHMSAICSLFYKVWFKNGRVYHTNKLFIHLCGTTLIIFVGCVLIDKIRILLLEKPVLKRIKKYVDRIDNLKLE